MKSFNISFKNKKHLYDYIKLHKINNEKNVLVQVFSGLTNTNQLLEINSYIQELIPSASIIGTTTAGEILDGKMYEKNITISITVFESSTVESKLVNLEEKHSIEKELSQLIHEKTKVLILFSDRFYSNVEDLLNKITRLYPDIIVTGGRAGYDVKLKKTFVFDEKQCLENAYVIATLSGDELIANNEYMLNWQEIGKKMKVTKSDNNILYEVDGIKVKNLYEKYLGKDISDSLPESGIEFPLISIRDGVKIARVPISKNRDKSLLLSGALKIGDSVQFSYANISNITNAISNNYLKFQNFPSESIFIYSCVSRKNLIGKELESEFQMLNSLAPTAGFFTNGEFFHTSSSNQLLSMATTFLALSETSELKEKVPYLENIETNNKIFKALSHLTSVTTKELEYKNRELQRLSDMTSNLVLYTTSDLEGNITFISKAYEEFLDIASEKIIGKNHNIFRHPATHDDFYTDMWSKLHKNKRFIGELQYQTKSKKECWIKLTIEPMFDENGVKTGYSAYREDMTEKKRLEFISAHDALTSLYNRGEFIKVMNAKIKSTKRHGGTFGFVIFDIDYFKAVNDTFGHSTGDDVLIKLSQFLSKHICEDDFLARWGGEEFVIIFNNTTLKNIEIFIQKLQNKLTKISFAPITKLTLSFGLTQYKDNDTEESLLHRADMALYSAKHNGRDRYEINT